MEKSGAEESDKILSFGQGVEWSEGFERPSFGAEIVV